MSMEGNGGQKRRKQEIEKKKKNGHTEKFICFQLPVLEIVLFERIYFCAN